MKEHSLFHSSITLQIPQFRYQFFYTDSKIKSQVQALCFENLFWGLKRLGWEPIEPIHFLTTLEHEGEFLRRQFTNIE